MRLGGAPWPGILTMVQKNSWLCSLDMGPSCTDPPDARDLRPGRVLVVGGSDAASPVRYVYQSEKGAMRRLVSIAEDFSGTDRIVDVPAFFASETFVDLAGSRGRWIVVTDTTTGALQFWDTANGTLPSALARDASGRPAIASVGTDQYALAYADTAGALDVNAVSCAADCAVPPLGSETQRLVPASGASYLLPALTETPLGEVALAYVERTPGTPDVVHLEVLSSAVEPRPWSPVVAYTAGPGRAVIDVQIASAHDAHEAMIALAILEGPAGSTTGDAIWVMTAAAPDACF
jgi:hypothetical protein